MANRYILTHNTHRDHFHGPPGNHDSLVKEGNFMSVKYYPCVRVIPQYGGLVFWQHESLTPKCALLQIYANKAFSGRRIVNRAFIRTRSRNVQDENTAQTASHQPILILPIKA
jgi:hypothetical protein